MYLESAGREEVEGWEGEELELGMDRSLSVLMVEFGDSEPFLSCLQLVDKLRSFFFSKFDNISLYIFL